MTDTPFDPLKLPPELRAVGVAPGCHRGGFKSMIHGPAKSGKSYWLASQPSPNLALACGENGIGMYMNKAAGDYVIQVYNADTFDKAVRFATKNEKNFASLSIDNGNIAFKQWLEHWEKELKVDEIKGKSWKPTKESWNELTFMLMDTMMNVGMGFWPRGAKWTQEETESAMPGAEAKTKLKIQEQDVAHAETKIPFAIDMMFKSDIVLDKKFAPTPIHTITYFGGRRPVTVPPEQLYTGKVWKFDSRKPPVEGPWQHIVGPLLPYWNEGAVDHLDVDPAKSEAARSEIRESHNNTFIGECAVAFKSATGIADLARFWEANIVEINALPEDKKRIVTEAKDKRKKELS